MAVITIQNVQKQFGKQIVLEGASLEVSPNETLGLVGPNGCGKTTLFRMIAAGLKPDLGTVTLARGQTVGYLRQEPEVSPDRTLIEEMRGVFEEVLLLEARLQRLSEEIAERHDGPDLPALMTEYERISQRFEAGGGYNYQTAIHEVLGGLGFSAADHAAPIALFSGGQKCRAALAKLLLEDPSILLLDEPTNHLDIDAVRWLEKWLAGRHGGKIIISHDRYLLDRVVDRIVELERKRLFSYPGNYSNFVQAKSMRLLALERQYEKDMDFIRKEQAFIDKHIARQRSKEAKGRRTRLERRMSAGEFVTEKPSQQRQASIGFAQERGGYRRKQKASSQTVVELEGVAMGFENKPLFQGLNLQINEGQRLGITGPNGTGKTTLLRIILGQVDPLAGEVSVSSKYRIGYYDQEHSGLDPERTAVEEIRSVDQALTEEQARSLLGRYLFTGEAVFKTLGTLSGGEQSRVRLAKLILSRPEVLILDEPTNHLDIASREMLEEALVEFEGTIITVSHDRYFLDRVADQLLVMRPADVRLYKGNYSYYIAQVEVDREGPAARAAKAGEKKSRRGRDENQPRKKSSPYDRLSLEEIEELIMELEVKLAELHERFGVAGIVSDPDAPEELKEEADAVQRELTEIDAYWHERVDEQG